jgi:hypothetical protein
MRCRCSAFVDLVALIPGTIEMDAVGFEICSETVAVVCKVVVPAGMCITFRVLSLSNASVE